MARQPKKSVAGKANPRKPPAKASAGEPPRLKKGARTIPVHALADDRIHLAAAQLGRLRQGYLKTLCGLQAVSELSPFALADPKRARCRICFRKVDGDGLFAG